MAKKKGFFTRLIEGPERSEDYARNSLPTNRWQLGWDLFTTNTIKLLKINLLVLLFIFPLFLLLYFRLVLIQSNGINSSFSQNIAIGYPAVPTASLLGVAETIVFNSDILFFIALLVCSFLFSVGISGGFYVMRNLVWTEGVFVVSDFWSGVKKNYSVILRSTLLFVFFIAITILTVDLCKMQIAMKNDLSWLFTIIEILSYIIAVIITITYLYMLSVGVTYKLSFFSLIRNALILAVGFLPINAFFTIFALVFFALLLFDISSIFFAFGLVFVVFLAISIFLLIWTNYTQWVFDQVINDNVKGAKKYRGINKKTSSGEPEEFVYKKKIFGNRVVKPITDTEIEIATLPESYSRADLIRLEESKKLMMEDSDRYEKEHADELSAKEAIDEFMSDVTEEDEIVQPKKTVNQPRKPSYKKKGKK